MVLTLVYLHYLLLGKLHLVKLKIFHNEEFGNVMLKVK